MFPAQALWVCDKCLGPLEVIYDYDKVRHDMTRAKIESRAKNCGATASCCRSTASRAPASFRIHPARQSRSPAKALGVASCISRTTPSTIRRSRTRIASSRSRRRAPSSWIQDVRLRVDRQPGQQRVGARRAPRPAVLRVHSERSRSEQDSRLERVQPAGRRHQGQLRRREPAVHADRGKSTAGTSRTSTCAATTPKARRRTASKSPSSSAGSSRSTSSRRWRAARCCRASRARSAS